MQINTCSIKTFMSICEQGFELNIDKMFNNRILMSQTIMFLQNYWTWKSYIYIYIYMKNYLLVLACHVLRRKMGFLALYPDSPIRTLTPISLNVWMWDSISIKAVSSVYREILAAEMWTEVETILKNACIIAHCSTKSFYFVSFALF